jgi:hypothetical protein
MEIALTAGLVSVILRLVAVSEGCL